jgi:hypothetical protein
VGTLAQRLEPGLDWSTFQLGNLGFGSTSIAIPAGLQHYDTTVSVTEIGQAFDVVISLDLNPATGVFTASFQSIDPSTDLPPTSVLTGFLPPEDGSGRGLGFVSFTISPKTGLATGTQVRNVAQVAFDFAQSIATDQVNDQDPTKGIDPTKQALITIDAGPPTSNVNPLPAASPGTFTLTWSGSDDPGGSGIASNDVYVSDNGGPVTLWQNFPATQTSAAFAGQPGHSYGFYSVATDNVGNVQPTPSRPQATTQVPFPSSITLASDHAGGSTYGKAVTITATVSAPSGTPAGAVQLTVDGSAAGPPVPLTSGSAPLALPSLTAGSRSITATFTSTVPSIAGSTTASPLPQSVTAAPLTITADNQPKAYGAGLPPLTVYYSGFVNGDTAASLTTAPTVTTTATAASGVGTYPITVSGATDPNYTITFVPGTLTIAPPPAPLTGDVTNLVSWTFDAAPGSKKRKAGGFTGLLTIRNNSGQPLEGPFNVELRGLKSTVKLRAAAGSVGTRKTKRPFLIVPVPGGSLQPGTSLSVTLRFSGTPNHFTVSVFAATLPR